MAKLTQERAIQLLRLDAETGILTWRVNVGSRGRKGERAGYVHTASRYRYIRIDGTICREHLIIWLMLYGEWLPREVDHKDLDRANNRPTNLRRASESEQRSNAKLRSDNAIGERGVTLHRASGLYVAEVRRGTRRIVKYFHTIPEAAACARALRQEMFGQFAPTYDGGK